MLVGVVLGAAAMWTFARLPQSIGAFAPVASVAAAALSFGVADVIGGSGFLAVYLVGLAVGSTPSRYRRQLVSFHEGLAFLAQVTMFVVLGLLVFPRQLPAVALSGLALAALLVFVIRPAAVWISTAFSNFTCARARAARLGGLSRSRADRARRPSCSRPTSASSETIFNAVFFVVVVSALVQGTTLERVAERLGLVSPAPAVAAAPLEVDEMVPLELVEFAVGGDDAIAGAAVRELGLPRSALVAVVSRDGESIPPRGNTVVPAGRPPVRARADEGARRSRGRVRALAPPRLRLSWRCARRYAGPR